MCVSGNSRYLVAEIADVTLETSFSAFLDNAAYLVLFVWIVAVAPLKLELLQYRRHIRVSPLQFFELESASDRVLRREHKQCV